MDYSLSTREKLVEMYFSDLRALRFVTVFTHLVAGLSFLSMSGGNADPDYMYLMQLFPHWVWGGFFLFVSCSRLLGAFVWPGNKFTRLFSPFLSTWLWAMLLFSSSAFKSNGGMSYLYLVCVAVEFWTIAQYLTYVKERKVPL